MSIEKNLNNLVINKVESQDVYNYMKANSLINADELYFVSGNEEEVNIPAAGDTLGTVKSGGDVTISDGIITVNDDSHDHVISNVDGLQGALDSKVDKIDGKGLSTNDLTSTLKSNYDAAYTHSQQPHASADAEKNVIVGVQKNGTDLAVNSSTRKVNITVPTKTSELTNDSDFATTSDLDAKVDKVTGKGLSTNDYTTEEKTKLANIEDGANKTIVDTVLSSTSTNPVQNKAINTKLDSMQSDIDSKVPSSRTVNGKALTANITLSASDVGALPNTIQIPSIDGLATETYVDNKVAGLVNSAPAALDTLNELAAALGDDPNFATTVANQIGTKVDKVEGKGLSTNDLTSTLKSNYDTAYIHSQQAHNYAGSSTSGGAATSANKLNTDAGSTTRPVYFKNGVPTVIDELDSVAFDGYVTKGAESGSTIGTSATVEGGNNMASSKQSHAEGGYTRAGDLTLYSESTGMFDSYGYEHAEGFSTLAKKCAAHAEGAHTQAIASMAHAEGLSTIASGGKSHAEGHSTTASGPNAHAEGYSTTASGENTHAEGNSTTASSQAAHAEGHSTEASGYASHSEGASTIASGSYSHTEGFYTKAASQYQHVQGKYNIEDAADTYAHIVGNGTSDTTRSNAHTLDWNGNAWFAGKVTSENADYAEVGQWTDGNTNDEDRIGYFVAIDDTSEGRTMVKATSTADVRGVTVDSPAFSGGYSADKADSNGELFKQYDYVAIMGIVPVIDNGTCTVNGRCMPADDGTAIPSTNNLGYQIIERIDSTRVMIVLEPGVDMTQRIKTDIEELQNGKMDAPFKPAGKSYLTFSSPNSFTLKVNDTTKHWNGTLEYFASDKTWTVWDGTATLSAVDNDGEYVLYLRGTGNTFITGDNTNYKWVFTGSDISCIGNIENLLDYATVESGAHPTMATNCYRSMFRDCTSLTQAPALPATTLATYCYHSMFLGCTSLTQAPALPATTLATYCYSAMFNGCTSLTQAPALPATTLATYCYSAMFSGCTSLTQAPALPATTLADYCYNSMFRDCTSLTQAPALPATTLATNCYQHMFYGCTSLTQAPALPATTLANRCYNSMFNGCASLKLSSTQTGEYTVAYRIPTTGTGTTATDALTDMFASTGGTFAGTPEINTTYYLSSDNMVVRETEIATLNGYVGSMIDAATPKSATVTLAAASWDSTAKTQTVTVTGVSATETDQMITPTPALASQSAYYDAGILCTGQAADSLTFTADTIPTADLTVYVVIQEVSA